jgi:hypothetical protein
MGTIVKKFHQISNKTTPAKAHAILKRIRADHRVHDEGAYTSLIFNTYKLLPESPYHNPKNKNNYKILMAGRMISDNFTEPVVWKVGSSRHHPCLWFLSHSLSSQNGILHRCCCSLVHECFEHQNLRGKDARLMKPSRCLSHQETARSPDQIPPLYLRPLRPPPLPLLLPGCELVWMPLPYRVCAPSVVGRPLNEVVLKNVSQSIASSLLISVQGTWYYNDEQEAARSDLFPAAFFHFR